VATRHALAGYGRACDLLGAAIFSLPPSRVVSFWRERLRGSFDGRLFQRHPQLPTFGASFGLGCACPWDAYRLPWTKYTLDFPRSLSPRRCVAVTAAVRMLTGMTKRFELKLSAEQRCALDELAAEVGLSVADLCRIGAGWVLNNRAILTGGPPVAARQAGERAGA
jgi:hypothetical protein